MLSDQMTSVAALSPYAILGLSRTATDSEVEAQYLKLRSRNRKSRAKKNLVRSAYDQIMMERKFKNDKQDSSPSYNYKPVKYQAPAHIDEQYVYGYKLSN